MRVKFVTDLSQSDHPVLNSRFLLYEAQQAHHYGLKPNLALLSVTGTPAKVMGVDHRVGFLKVGEAPSLFLCDLWLIMSR